jgi:antirestriction protein ArdC
MHLFPNSDEPESAAKVPILRYSYAFNLSQTTLYSDTTEVAKIIPCEELLKRIFPAPVIKNNIHRCYFDIAGDYISIPIITDFDNPEEYYSSLYHELIHWAGSPKRLNRDFSSINKVEEELIAEIGSAYLCGLTGISSRVIDGNSSYIGGWLQKVKDDKGLFIRASVSAQKAVEFLLCLGKVNVDHN